MWSRKKIILLFHIGESGSGENYLVKCFLEILARKIAEELRDDFIPLKEQSRQRHPSV